MKADQIIERLRLREHPEGGGAWQSTRSRAETPEGYTLAGCTVSPAFRVEGFELVQESFEEGG